ncbi:MAG: hypothetical protein Q8L85_05135 [Alphaproteobacteria bacterium]|nr:hypothetical protein [Alphaproteobacteria bacterium]
MKKLLLIFCLTTCNLLANYEKEDKNISDYLHACIEVCTITGQNEALINNLLEVMKHDFRWFKKLDANGSLKKEVVLDIILEDISTFLCLYKNNKIEVAQKNEIYRIITTLLTSIKNYKFKQENMKHKFLFQLSLIDLYLIKLSELLDPSKKTSCFKKIKIQLELCFNQLNCFPDFKIKKQMVDSFYVRLNNIKTYCLSISNFNLQKIKFLDYYEVELRKILSDLLNIQYEKTLKSIEGLGQKIYVTKNQNNIADLIDIYCDLSFQLDALPDEIIDVEKKSRTEDIRLFFNSNPLYVALINLHHTKILLNKLSALSENENDNFITTNILDNFRKCELQINKLQNNDSLIFLLDRFSNQLNMLILELQKKEFSLIASFTEKINHFIEFIKHVSEKNHFLPILHYSKLNQFLLNELLLKDSDTALYFLNESLQLSDRIKEPSIQGLAYEQAAFFFINHQNIHEALGYLLSAINFYGLSNNKEKANACMILFNEIRSRYAK